MVRVAAALILLVVAGACRSYSSGKAARDLILIAARTADDATDDCESPRTSFQPTSPSTSNLGVRLTAVALVYRHEPPRRPHSVIGTLRSSVSADSMCLSDLVGEIRGHAIVEGCDAVVVGDEATGADRRTSLEGSCLVFPR